ncbi:hypothetical protein TetV_496 [Tetraselmis virus 1]|uniref:Uncharacterized protein n=1 Tax=Tetraselmis virus 1 TaxID=2060617 RepID=A0A2P0VNV1_9VIRU|nr:hypothetical protein QJ968_gp558 [Tetraselmis virus 1]AUF82578.1 hypothetical protein TetV_496 [Tetraselmis virus 1]
MYQEITLKPPSPASSKDSFFSYLHCYDNLRKTVKQFKTLESIQNTNRYFLSPRLYDKIFRKRRHGLKWNEVVVREIVILRFEYMYESIQTQLYDNNDIESLDYLLDICAENIQLLPAGICLDLVNRFVYDGKLALIINRQIDKNNSDWIRFILYYKSVHNIVVNKIYDEKMTSLMIIFIKEYGIPNSIAHKVFGDSSFDTEQIILATNKHPWITLSQCYSNHYLRNQQRKRNPSLRPLPRIFYKKMLENTWKSIGFNIHGDLINDINYLIRMNTDDSITTAELDDKIDEMLLMASREGQNPAYLYLFDRSPKNLTLKFQESVIMGANLLKRKREP